MKIMSNFNDEQRSLCARLIEQFVKTSMADQGMYDCCCSWHLGNRLHHSDLHRLDIHIKDETVRIYFTDDELCDFSEAPGDCVTRTRLQQLIAEFAGQAFVSSSMAAIRRLAQGVRP